MASRQALMSAALPPAVVTLVALGTTPLLALRLPPLPHRGHRAHTPISTACPIKLLGLQKTMPTLGPLRRQMQIMEAFRIVNILLIAPALFYRTITSLPLHYRRHLLPDLAAVESRITSDSTPLDIIDILDIFSRPLWQYLCLQRCGCHCCKSSQQ